MTFGPTFVSLLLALLAIAFKAPAAGPDPVQMKPVETLKEAAAMTFATRRLLHAFRWGNGPGELQRTPSGNGGFEDDSAPAEILHAGGRRFWLRDPIGGGLVIVDTASGATAVVDLRAGLPDILMRTPVYSYGMARTGEDEVAVLAGVRPPGMAGFRYFVRRFNSAGEIRGRVLVVAAEAWTRDTPRVLFAGPLGTLWVGLRRETVVLDTAGRAVARVPAAGVLLASGVFLSDGAPPRLYDGQGGLVGTVGPAHAESELPQWLASGPGDVLLTPVAGPSPAPASRPALELYQIRRLMLPQRQLVSVDLVAVPARRLQTPRAEAPDATPLRSYFPPRGMAFTLEGDLVQLELTDSECRVFLLRRLKPGEDWVHKFAAVGDASRAELELLRNEYLARLGMQLDAGPYGDLFVGMAWRLPEPSRRPGQPGSAGDPVLQRLRPSAVPGNADRDADRD